VFAAKASRFVDEILRRTAMLGVWKEEIVNKQLQEFSLASQKFFGSSQLGTNPAKIHDSLILCSKIVI